MATQDAHAVHSDRPSYRFTSSVFPQTRCSLWDKSSVGQPVLLHISHYRKPRVSVPEKILKLVQHQCENYGQVSHVLIGTLVVDDDGEGVQIQVDRLDTRQNVLETSLDLTAGNVFIYLHVTNNKASERAASAEDYVHALKHLQSRCSSRESIDLCSFLHLSGWGSFYSSAQTSLTHLDFDMITMEMTFKSTPVTPVPIALTALSKNLASPRSLSSMQGTPKTGYLTMDNTRKLLLVLESDPKTAVLPVIGIWVSGVEFIHHPFVWAACLRYINNTHLQDRVCVPPEPFLLVLYTPLHSRPEFYQCETSNTSLQFELSSGHEVINMDKVLTNPGSGSFVEVEMEPVHTGSKVDIFDAAKTKYGVMTDTRGNYLPGQEDLEPRCAPTPHAEKVPVFQPMVPDVSVLWTEAYESYSYPSQSHRIPSYESISQHPQELTSHMGKPLRQSFPAQTKNSCPVFGLPAGEHTRHSSQTRPILSHQYSAARQTGQCLPTSISLQSSPQAMIPSQQNGPHFSMAGQLSQTNIPLAHPRTLQNSTNASSLMPQQFTQSFPANRQALTTSVATSDSYNNYNHHLNTSTVSCNQNSQLSETRNGGGQVLELDKNRPHSGYPPHHLNSRMIQHFSNCQPVTSSPRPAQSHSHMPGTVSLANSIQAHPANMQTQSSNQQLTAVSQHIQAASNRDCLQHRATLKTINEETSSSSSFCSLQKLGQHLESQRVDILELNNIDLKCHESSNSPFSHHSTNIICRSAGEDSGFSTTSDRLSLSVPEQVPASVVPFQPQAVASLGAGLPEHSAASKSPMFPFQPPAVTSLGAGLPEHIAASVSPKFPFPPGSSPSQPCIENIKWEQIPAEVRAVLIQQNEQLKQLQQQIQILQAQHLTAGSKPVSVVSVASDVVRLPKAVSYNSVAVNTSCWDEESNSSDKHKRWDCQHAELTSVGVMCQQEQLVSPGTAYNQTDVNNSATSPLKAGRRQLVSGRGDALPALAGSYMDHVASQSPLGWSHSSLEDVNQKDLDDAVAGLHVLEQTMNTEVSGLVVDIPEYASSFNDRSHPEDNPSSVSDYCTQTQEDSYSTLGEDAADPKQYYSQLMKNIQMFLTSSGSHDSKTSSPSSVDPETALQVVLSKFESPASSMIVPEISSLSMLLGYGSDTGQSMEINALAMKYLSDEQLTHMARLRQSTPSTSHKSAYSAKILQQVIGGCKLSASGTTSTPDVSRLGISPNDMTMETLMYLEKHGLLGHDRSVFELPHEMQLRTDFSILTNGNAAALSLTSNCRELHYDESVIQAETLSQHPPHSPHHPSRPPHPSLTGPAFSPAVLHTATRNHNKDKIQTGSAGQGQHNDVRKRNGLKEVKAGAGNSHVNSRVEEEEENLLDIQMLKQMPKLL